MQSGTEGEIQRERDVDRDLEREKNSITYLLACQYKSTICRVRYGVKVLGSRCAR